MKYYRGCDIEQFIREMTLDQKIDLEATLTSIMSKAMPELGLPSMCIADGATGINYLQVYLDRMQQFTKEPPKSVILNLDQKEDSIRTAGRIKLPTYNPYGIKRK